MKFLIDEGTNFSQSEYQPALSNADKIMVFKRHGSDEVSNIIEENDEVAVYKKYNYTGDCTITWSYKTHIAGDWNCLNKKRRTIQL